MLEHIPPPAGRTLRQQVETALKLGRELDEHLRQTLSPAAVRLRRTAAPEAADEKRSDRPGSVKQTAAPAPPADPRQQDRAVRHAVDALLETERFAEEVRARLDEYCGSIRAAVARELKSGAN